MRVYGPSDESWTAQDAANEDTVATCSKAADVANRRNVCTGLTVMFTAGPTAPTPIMLRVRLIDGGATDTTYLWSTWLALPAVAGASTGVVNLPCWKVGSAGKAMTLQFEGPGGAYTYQAVAMEGTIL